MLGFAVAAFAVWMLVVGLAWALQRRMMYFPEADEPAAPPGVEDVTLQAADGVTLRAWWWPGSRDAALLVLHGNAGNRGDRLGWMAPFHALGWGVFLLDYRGYGGSAGSPDEPGLIDDAQAARAWLDADGVGRIAYLGESIGCSVAVALAERAPPDALVLQSGADSILAVARGHYPWLPVRWLMRDRWESLPRVAGLAAPLLSIHGDSDTIVPIARGRTLFDAYPGGKEWLEIPGAGHNDLPFVDPRGYVDAVHRFLERHLEPASPERSAPR